MIDNNRLVHLLEAQNPVVHFFKRLHKRFEVPVDFEKLEYNYTRQVSVLEAQPPSAIYSPEGSSLLDPIDINSKEVSMQEFLIYFRLPYELIKDKEDITSFVAKRINFRLGDIVKTQSCGNHPIQWTSLPESKIFLTDFRVMSSLRYECLSYEIAAKCKVGVLLSTKLHTRIIDTMCRSCAKRLKCTLIPEDVCNLSYLVDSYDKFGS